MTCPDHNQLSAFVEGGLPTYERTVVQGHIDQCSDCFELIVELAKLTTPDMNHDAEVSGDAGTMAVIDGEMSMAPARPLRGNIGTMVGRTIDNRYLLSKLIGQGGFAEVYSAVQLSVGRDVAIKVLSSSLNDQPHLISRFEAEAKIISKLKHPNILKLIDFGTTADDRLYIVIELLEGRPIDHVLGDGAIEQKRFAGWLKQICGALQEAHKAGIVHRDLKPSNLFLETINEQDFVKVLDFGIAKIADTKQTVSGVIMGTPNYMSPEQIEARAIDRRTDLYSLGVIAFEALTGQAPFSGDTPVMVMYKHAKQAAPQISQIDDSVHPALAALVEALLSKQPEDRPKDAAQVIKFLDAIDWSTNAVPPLDVEGASFSADIPTVDEPADLIPAPSASLNTQPDGPPSIHASKSDLHSSVSITTEAQTAEPKTNQPRAFALMTAMIIIVGVGAWWLGGQHSTPPRIEPISAQTKGTESAVVTPAPPKSPTADVDAKVKLEPKPTGTITLNGAAKDDAKTKGASKSTQATQPTAGATAQLKEIERNKPATKPSAVPKTTKITGKRTPVKMAKSTIPPVTPSPKPVVSVAQLNLKLSPKKSFYGLSQTPKLIATALRSDGSIIAQKQSIVWTITPTQSASVQKGGQLKFKTLGRVTVHGCIGRVCSKVRTYVRKD